MDRSTASSPARVLRRRAVLAGVGLTAGALSAPALAFLPLPGLCLLAALCWSLARRWAAAVGWFAAGTAIAAASWVLPARETARFDSERPVTLIVERQGVWRDRGSSFFAEAEALLRRQGSELDLRPLDVMVFWPGTEPPPSATRLRLRGYLRPPSTFFNGFPEPRSGGTWFFAVESPRLAEPLAAGAPRWRRPGGGVLDRARAALDRALPAASRGGSSGQSVGGALLLGDGGRLDAELASAMRRQGLAHLPAASGLHVGFVAGFWLLASGAGPRAVRLALPALAVLAFVLILGARPPLARAAGCFVCALAARALGRLPPSGSVLALSAGVLVTSDPSVAQDVGFQLSYAATVGILALQRPLERAFAPLPRLARSALAVSFAAQLATTPLVVARFAVLAPLAPLWNLLFVPWTALMLGAAALWATAELSLPGVLPKGLLDSLAWPFTWLEHVPTELGAVLPLHVGLLVGVSAAVLAAAAILARRRGAWSVGVAAAIVAAAVLATASAPRQDFEAHFLDVGQGDAILLRDGPRSVLVDGGGLPRSDVAARVLLPVLARLGVRWIDVAIVTHGDHDHCAGVLELARWIPVRELWVPPTLGDAPCGHTLIAERSRRMRVLAEGERLVSGRLRIDVLHAPVRATTPNRGSLVLAVSAGGRRLLLAGDVDASVERAVAARIGEDLRADVLKVAHHGSRTSTSEAFLALARPRIAVIQAGRRNLFGHPAPAVVERLGSVGAVVLRTDLDGRVSIAWGTGGGWVVGTARARRVDVDHRMPFLPREARRASVSP